MSSTEQIKDALVDSPTVSVVMSVFNGQTFLREAVESILAQTFTDFEFIIVDDGSTDKTAEILSGYAKRDNRVRVISQENRGRAESLNRGIALATAPLIARMDADDISLPHRLKEQVDFLDSHPEVGLLGGAYQRIDAKGRARGITRFPASDSEIRTVILQYNPMSHPAAIMRKDVALASGRYRTAFRESEDYDLWLRMAERTRLANLDQVVLQYRIHAHQVSARNANYQWLCVMLASRAAALRRMGHPDPLSGVEELTPQLLDRFRATPAEIEAAPADVQWYWIDALRHSDPELALRLIQGQLRLPRSERASRLKLADAWLKAAGIHYRQGRFAKALQSVGHGVAVRPIVAGRPIKRAFVRLAAALGG
ncbi:MAG TPA: glycosyltransferase [Candidatus Acidoferrales bacterium]|nr:glycosyltransferase [Candidatus Acidoferrales bacterium]